MLARRPGAIVTTVLQERYPRSLAQASAWRIPPAGMKSRKAPLFQRLGAAGHSRPLAAMPPD